MAKGGNWVWQKRVPLDEETVWEERLHEIENAVFSAFGDPAYGEDSGFGKVAAYCNSKREAESFSARWGGAVAWVEETDWVAESARTEPPLKIRDRLVVTQETTGDALDALAEEFPGRTLLSVPAQMAFGTGHHATTSTCLRMLSDIGKERGSGWSMIDIGAGTGLLALGARVFGAAEGEVDAFDYDPKAVEISRENAELNEISGIEFFEADVLSWQPRRRYDVVAANLYSGLLEKALPTMAEASEPRADLILSGILLTQLDDVLRAAKRAGFAITKSVPRGRWAGVRGVLKG